LLGTTSYNTEYPFDQLGSDILAVSSSDLLLTPSILGGGEQEKEKALTLCKQCSATAETLVCYQHWFSHKSKAQHPTGCCEES